MLQLPDHAKFRRSLAALVFRTVIVDRAGQVPWCRPVVAEIVETDIAGTAILLTPNRTHLQFPVHALHQPTAGVAETLMACPSILTGLKAFHAAGFAYVGGQEVVWDLHHAVTPASLRYLTTDELAEALAVPNALVDADA